MFLQKHFIGDNFLEPPLEALVPLLESLLLVDITFLFQPDSFVHILSIRRRLDAFVYMHSRRLGPLMLLPIRVINCIYVLSLNSLGLQTLEIGSLISSDSAKRLAQHPL